MPANYSLDAMRNLNANFDVQSGVLKGVLNLVGAVWDVPANE